MPNWDTRKLAMGAMMRSPERTWDALALLRDGRIEEGLQLLHDLAHELVEVDWHEVDVDYLVLVAYQVDPADTPTEHLMRHTTLQ